MDIALIIVADLMPLHRLRVQFICINSPFNSYFLPVLVGQLAQLTYRKQPNMKEQPQKPKHEHDWAAQIGK